MAVQSFAAAWNMVEANLMNGELVFIIIMSVKVLVIIATRLCIHGSRYCDAFICDNLASSPGSLHGFTGNTEGGAARKKESLVRTVRACANLIAENT